MAKLLCSNWFNFCLHPFRTTATSLNPLKVLSFITSTSFCFWHLDRLCTCTCITSTRRLMTSKGKSSDDQVCLCMCASVSAGNGWLYFPLRYKKRSVVKLAGSFESTSATNITAMSSINDFFSCILFFCCYFWHWRRNIRVWSAEMSLRATWTLSSFAWRISLAHLQANHSDQPGPHEAFTCCLKGFHRWLNL